MCRHKGNQITSSVSLLNVLCLFDPFMHGPPRPPVGQSAGRSLFKENKDGRQQCVLSIHSLWALNVFGEAHWSAIDFSGQCVLVIWGDYYPWSPVEGGACVIQKSTDIRFSSLRELNRNSLKLNQYYWIYNYWISFPFIKSFNYWEMYW